MTDRLDPTALPIFGATPPAETPPNTATQTAKSSMPTDWANTSPYAIDAPATVSVLWE